MGGGGYGTIVDAGSVLFALSPGGKLVVFEPNGKEFKEIASYKVADPGGAEKSTHAYPVIAGNRIFVKDANSVTLWTIE
jgi:outer membrane protein assembly factor BamB